MILMIDNYDSFTYNLYQYFCELGAEVVVKRNDEVQLTDIEQLSPSHLVISPGPCTPNEAGISLAAISHFAGKVPILGVCLGHQAIGEFFGAKLIKNAVPTHGKVHSVHQTKPHFFTQGLPESFQVTRYHSLQLRDLPDSLESILATESGEIMGIAHQTLPILGIQYHPEAYLTEYGLDIIQNWIKTMGGEWNQFEIQPFHHS